MGKDGYYFICGGILGEFRLIKEYYSNNLSAVDYLDVKLFFNNIK